MKQSKPSIIHSVNVFQVGADYYVVPTVRDQYGMWVEVNPVAKLRSTNPHELAAAIQEAKNNSSPHLTKWTAWDSENGYVWNNASHLWCIDWSDNGTVTVTPEHRVPTKTDPVTGEVLDGGWADDVLGVRSLPSDTPMLRIAQLLIIPPE